MAQTPPVHLILRLITLVIAAAVWIAAGVGVAIVYFRSRQEAETARRGRMEYDGERKEWRLPGG